MNHEFYINLKYLHTQLWRKGNRSGALENIVLSVSRVAPFVYITSQYDLGPHCLVFKSYKCAVRVGVLSSVMTPDRFQGNRKHTATHSSPCLHSQFCSKDFSGVCQSLLETCCLQDRRWNQSSEMSALTKHYLLVIISHRRWDSGIQRTEVAPGSPPLFFEN